MDRSKKRKSRVIPVFVILLLLSLVSGVALAHAQETTRVPDLLLSWTDIYSSTSSTMTLAITFSTVDLDKYNKPSITPASANQDYGDSTDEGTNTVTMHWQPRTNSSVDWTIDLLMNYTVAANRVILIGTVSVDCIGNRMNTGPFPFTIPDAQNVWVRILITTRPSPCYPTPQELDTSRDPHHPTNERLTNLENAINGPWGLKFTVTIQTVVIVLLTVAVLALAGFILFVLRHQGG